MSKSSQSVAVGSASIVNAGTAIDLSQHPERCGTIIEEYDTIPHKFVILASN